jgi:hypothetical protein
MSVTAPDQGSVTETPSPSEQATEQQTINADSGLAAPPVVSSSSESPLTPPTQAPQPNAPSAPPGVNPFFYESLVEMGFPKVRVEKGPSKVTDNYEKLLYLRDWPSTLS